MFGCISLTKAITQNVLSTPGPTSGTKAEATVVLGTYKEYYSMDATTDPGTGCSLECPVFSNHNLQLAQHHATRFRLNPQYQATLINSSSNLPSN